MLHQYLNTKVIKDLSKIIRIPVDQISMDSISEYCKHHTPMSLAKKLMHWHKKYSQPKKKTLEGRDLPRFIISPLGETIKNILNKDKEIQKSLTNVARQVTLIQLNVNVLSKKMTFQSNYFKDAEFTFGWPGYSGGNKLGFKMKLKK